MSSVLTGFLVSLVCELERGRKQPRLQGRGGENQIPGRILRPGTDKGKLFRLAQLCKRPAKTMLATSLSRAKIQGQVVAEKENKDAHSQDDPEKLHKCKVIKLDHL